MNKHPSKRVQSFLSLKEKDRVKCCPIDNCSFRDATGVKNNSVPTNLLCKHIHKNGLYRNGEDKKFIQKYRCSKTRETFTSLTFDQEKHYLHNKQLSPDTVDTEYNEYNFTLQEIAKRHNTTISSVRKRLERATKLNKCKDKIRMIFSNINQSKSVILFL